MYIKVHQHTRKIGRDCIPPPCLVPDWSLNFFEKEFPHFTIPKLLEYQDWIIFIKKMGHLLSINLTNRACMLSRSNAFSKSIVHKFTVEPLFVKKSTTFRTV